VSRGSDILLKGKKNLSLALAHPFNPKGMI